MSEAITQPPPEPRHRLGAEVRRRPSGEAPPLPRQLGRTGKVWLAITVGFGLLVIVVAVNESMQAGVEVLDSAISRWFASWRVSSLTDVMEIIALVASRWVIRAIRWATIGTLIVFRRWRHLVVFVGAMITEAMLSYGLVNSIHRPRPLGVSIVGTWQGFSMPSRPISGLAATLIGVAYCTIPHGRIRDAAKWVIAAVLLVATIARLYLGVDHATGALFGALLGVAVTLTAFRWFAPNDVFPVTYQRGRAAHLDVGGARGEAIGRAIRDQLGYRVLEVKPVGLAGSGGSTPLRLRVRDELTGAEDLVFAKLYAKNHVRADRWYKLGRTILYGKLEDETPFQTVRRFVEYEDYTLRLMEDLGLPVPEPFGVVEITPEREYMIVMEFFEEAVEIGEADIDDAVIDQGLKLIRSMWDAGLAHRDIKPANLMVQGGNLKLIDVFFVQVRPSPWRQAVDLGNMMLVLALRSDAQRVYEHALRSFSPEEIAEAFAATRGIASPTQLRSMMKVSGRDLIADFQALAPRRPPMKIQRWSLRRLVLTFGVALAAFIAFGLVVSNWAVFA